MNIFFWIFFFWIFFLWNFFFERFNFLTPSFFFNFWLDAFVSKRSLTVSPFITSTKIVKNASQKRHYPWLSSINQLDLTGVNVVFLTQKTSYDVLRHQSFSRLGRLHDDYSRLSRQFDVKRRGHCFYY